MKNPFLTRWFSPDFFFTWLVVCFGGYYPSLGQLRRCAEPYFSLEAEDDGTLDYRYTSEDWLNRIRQHLFKPGNAGAIWGKFLAFLGKRPLHGLASFLGLYLLESWQWQFRGDPSPMRLLRQTWKYRPLP